MDRGKRSLPSALTPTTSIARTDRNSRVRVTMAAPSQPSLEGTIYTADPLTNLLVLHTSPATQTTEISPTTMTAPPGPYHIVPISQISSFQILHLPPPPPTASPTVSESTATPTAAANANTVDTAAVQARLARNVASSQAALARLGPKGTSPTDQGLFDALSRTHPARWSGNVMVISDTYLVEKPYGPLNVKLIESRHGDLERMKKVVEMERQKVTLRLEKGQLDGKIGTGGPRKGG